MLKEAELSRETRRDGFKYTPWASDFSFLFARGMASEAGLRLGFTGAFGGGDEKLVMVGEMDVRPVEGVL